MRVRSGSLWVACVVGLAVACTARPASPPTAPASAAPPDDNRTLVMAVRFEPATLVGLGLDPQASVSGYTAPTLLFHAGLAQQDEKAQSQPYLAEALPQLGTDSWQVFPDG